jgi:hypothetical protein
MDAVQFIAVRKASAPPVGLVETRGEEQRHRQKQTGRRRAAERQAAKPVAEG